MFNQYLYKTMESFRRSSEYMDTSINNMNNMFTTGYKSKRVTFHETLNGVKAQEHRDFATGMPQKTGRELDFAIEGKGFFEVQLPDGTLAYTRDGSFNLNANGELVTSQGYLVSSKTLNTVDVNKSYDDLSSGNGKFDLGVVSRTIQVPTGSAITLDPNTGDLTDNLGNALGSLQVVNFPNPDALVDVGDGIFLPAPQAGAPEPSIVGFEDGKTHLHQGKIEFSNTDIVIDMAKIKQQETGIKAQMKTMRLLDQLQESLNSTISRNL